MLILINGLPHFSRIMASDLNEFDAKNKYIFLNTYDSKWAQIKFILLLPFCGAVISFNGVSDKSKSLDWVIKMKKKLIMQWQGTDVQYAANRHKDGSINRKYIDYSTHLISSSWFKDELKDIVDHFVYAPFSYVKEAKMGEKYTKVSIISYIANGREKFYGWDELIEFAKNQPEIEITIVGTEGKGLEYPINVKCLGWVNESKFINLLKNNPIFVRLTDHDGKSISVAQALSYGCEVIWTYEFDNCYKIEKNVLSLQNQITFLQNRIEERGLIPNLENIKFAEDNLLRVPVMQNYCSIFNSILND